MTKATPEKCDIRQRYNEQARKAHVKAWQVGEQSIPDYCSTHGIACSTFYDWVHQYVGKLNKQKLKLPFSGICLNTESAESGFSSHMGVASNAVSIKLPSGIQLELASCPDVETMLAMIQGLRECS